MGFVLLAGLLLTSGCSKKQLEKLGESIDQKSSSLLEQAKKTPILEDVLPPTGEAQLTLETLTRFNGAYLRLLDIGNRGRVLQIRSYDLPANETFPSFFMQAQVDVSDVANLTGKVIKARLFVQSKEEGPVWFCDGQELVEVNLLSITDGQLSGNITGGKLRSSNQETSTVTGSFKAVLPTTFGASGQEELQ